MLSLRKIQEVLPALKIKEKINDIEYAIIDQDLLDLRLELYVHMRYTLNVPIY